MRFLLVENNEHVGFAIASGLEAYGHHVTLALAAAIRHHTRTIPIIFTTGHDTYPGLDEALRDPYARVLHKPFPISALLTIVDELVDAGTTRQQRRGSQ